MERFLFNPRRLFFFSFFTLSENMNRKILSLLFLLYNKNGTSNMDALHCNGAATAATAELQDGNEGESDYDMA